MPPVSTLHVSTSPTSTSPTTALPASMLSTSATPTSASPASRIPDYDTQATSRLFTRDALSRHLFGIENTAISQEEEVADVEDASEEQAMVPLDVACGFFTDLLPIVVVCYVKHAFKVELLNTEIFKNIQDAGDPDEIMDAISNSQHASRAFAGGERLNALLFAKETGIYCGLDWQTEVFPYTKYPKGYQERFDDLQTALLFMIQSKRQYIPTRRVVASTSQGVDQYPSRAALPVKRETNPVKHEPSPPPSPIQHRYVRSASPVKATHSMPPTSLSPSRGYAVQLSSGESISRSTSLPHVVTSVHGYPTVSISSSRRPHASYHSTRSSASKVANYIPERVPLSYSTRLQASASFQGPTSSSVRFSPEIDDETVVEDLNRLNLEPIHGGRQGPGTLTPDLLRLLVRPPREMLSEADSLLPALDLGPTFDRWSVAHNLQAGDVLHYLQAFLYAPSLSDFVRMLGRPGARAPLSPADSDYLWTVFEDWLRDAQE
ncbi:hypothetical protein C8Q78DRAFT_1075286 [Trametes maxima]|nr:hypothetical protein C8Q78DRAFT_1075286 [Trametes maxima]